jgi:2,5-diketo-D-gluconate reductase B
MTYQTIQGVEVPALGFGTWELNGPDCTEAVAHALSLGYRHIDTAQGYDNEEFVGEGLQRGSVPRDEIFLVTKVKPDNFRGERVLASTRESLTKLQTDYVDLLLMHWPNPDVPLEETLGAFLELREQGAVRHIGVSNFPSKLVNEAQQVATIFANQVEYHPYLGQRTLLEQARAQDYMLTAYSPIAQGKVLDDAVLREIGAAHGKNSVQVTLRWLIQQDHVVAIPKAASEKNRVGNIEIFDFELSDEEMARIFALERGERLVAPGDGPDWDK